MNGRALCLLLALGACAELPPALQLPGDQVDAAIREAAQLARAPAAEQKTTLAGAQQAFVGDSSTPNRLRLATLLATLAPPLREDARASELLEPLADPAGSAIGRFAAFLNTQIAERQRIAREVDRLSKERTALQNAEKERDKREEALRQQLEALRAIERGILDREERLRRNPGAKP